MGLSSTTGDGNIQRPVVRGSLRRISTAGGLSGTRCGILFFDRSAGMVHRPPPTSTSSHRMANTSPPRWAVSRRSRRADARRVHLARARARPSDHRLQVNHEPSPRSFAAGASWRSRSRSASIWSSTSSQVPLAPVCRCKSSSSPLGSQPVPARDHRFHLQAQNDPEKAQIRVLRGSEAGGGARARPRSCVALVRCLACWIGGPAQQSYAATASSPRRTRPVPEVVAQDGHRRDVAVLAGQQEISSAPSQERQI